MPNVSRKKVLLFITKARWGGAQRHVFDLATSLPKDRYDVAVAYGGDGQLATMLEEAGIRTIPIPGLTREISLWKEITSLSAIIRLVRQERPEILHVHSSKAGGLGAFAGRLARVPRIVFTAHAWEFNNKNRNVLARTLFAFLHWLTVILAHHTICVSHAVCRQMARSPFTTHRMSVVHPGIEPAAIRDRNDARKKIVEREPRLSMHQSETWIGTVAELHPVKNLYTAIDAIATLVKKNIDVRYVIIGDGDERSGIEEHIEKNGLVERVFLCGHIEKAAELMPAFDVFFLPSHSESFGYVVLEAGHARLAVVASDVGGIPEIITQNVSGILVHERTKEGFAEALQGVVLHPELRTELGGALYESAQTRFSKESMLTGVMRVYDTTYPQ